MNVAADVTRSLPMRPEPTPHMASLLAPVTLVEFVANCVRHQHSPLEAAQLLESQRKVVHVDASMILGLVPSSCYSKAVKFQLPRLDACHTIKVSLKMVVCKEQMTKGLHSNI
ncbi:hypothetical protein Nepgr_016152 [Nepenthes gracilis]|uniref:Uncharacterized protein n=1 Tax=Nepenthes gracilis TaxID=150966 RepID=A0AAD3XS00_NEPGR|nr:hypothetical protein Nepgr_016152 [Nepenthes gracilis]